MEYTTPEQVSAYMMMRRGEPKSITANITAGDDEITMGPNIVHFQAGMTVNISDSNYPLGEDVVIDSIDGTKMVLESDLVNDYAIIRNGQVFSYCPFSPRSLPSYNDVVTLIETIEAEIDKKIRKSFLSTGRVWKEWVTVELKSRLSWPYMQAPDSEDAATRRGFQLSRRPILQFDPDAEIPDQLMMKINGEMVDLLATGSTYTIWYIDSTTQRKDADIWVDQENATIYIMDTVALDYGFKDAYVVYHYSEQGLNEEIPKDITKATNMLVGAEIMMNDRYANNFPADTEAMIKPAQQIAVWKSNAYEILGRYRNSFLPQKYQ
jgi:hypothetical protein